METKRKRSSKMPNGFGSVRKLPGNRRRPWQAIVTVGWEIADGKAKQVQRPIGYTRTKVEAITLLTEYNKDPYAIGKDLTFADVYEKLDLSHKSVNIIRSLKTAYKRSAILHDMKMKDIRTTHIDRVTDSLTEMSPATQSEVKMLWRMIFDYAMKHDIIVKDYSKFANFYSEFESDKKLPFTADEVKQFSDDLLILCLTGMRISEYLGMKTEDIHDGCFFVNGTKTKSAVRVIPIHEKLAVIVADRLKQAYLCEYNGKNMKYDLFLKKVFVPEMEALNIEGHTIHDTRRTFATFASRSGMDVNITKRLLGHVLNDITEDVYTHKNYNDLKAEMDKLTIN